VAISSVSIIGLGLIGGSIAKALKKSDLELEIRALDKPDILRKAGHEKSIDTALISKEEAAESDVIIIALPLDAALSYFEELIPLVSDNTIITDVCGVKSAFYEKWNELKQKGYYIGGHPMTGKEKGGYQNSDPLLFENSIYILTNETDSIPNGSEFLNLIQTLGCRIAHLNPAFHDEIVAHVSHLPQLLSVSLVNSVANENSDQNILSFSAGGFRDMTRIASSAFEIWEPVLKSNKEKIIAALENFSSELNEMKKLLSKEDFEAISGKFENSRKNRDEVPKNNKGFITPLYDLYVFVEDQPGVISKISTALYDEGINIKDIELLKIREGTGGTFRISFDSDTDRRKAGWLMETIGFTVNK
jgi:prephenate dehydrogenase